MKKTLLSIGIGAGVMYLLDPELGEIRRSLLKDKLRGVLPKTADAIHGKADALSAKAQDLTHIADEAAADAISHAVPQLDANGASADGAAAQSDQSEDEKSQDDSSQSQA